MKSHWWWAFAPLLLALPAAAQEQVKPYILINIDTSGSMGWDVCANGFAPPVVDDTVECPGSDVACATCNSPPYCGNGLPDDGRLSKVKRGTIEAINAFGEATYALARFSQAPAGFFACPGGGWSGTCNGADILVPFAEDNQREILDWLDGCDNWPTPDDCQEVANVAPVTGCSLCPTCGGSCDKELRPLGGTPIAGSLQSINAYLGNVMSSDPFSECRPYVVIMLTDGGESCGGNPTNQARNICTNLGVPVYVVGFATTTSSLNSIADAGCDPGCDSRGCRNTPILVDNETDLALAFAEIIQSAVLKEVCNGLDDDCDGLIDEDFPGLGEPCCDPCAGTIICNPTGDGTMCSGVPPCDEICDAEDNDCDGLVDEFLNCVYEVCNGIDDDGDGETDELPLPGLGAPCGSDEGECKMGVTCCAQEGNFACCGAKAPEREICDCLDNNCNSQTDEGATRRCYGGPPSECPDPESGFCVGLCKPGGQVCVTDSCPTPTYGPCLGEVGPREETCNCLDDNCNGLTDDGAVCSNGAPCISCNCATPCDPANEFPCPAGRICTGHCPGTQEPFYCIPAPCLGRDCGPGFMCQECTGECVDLCEGVDCGELTCCGGWCCDSWEACEDVGDGVLACVDVSCTNDEFACPEGQVCEDHRCVANPCDGVNCAPDELCRDGECLPACPVCNPDERCQEGRCVLDDCAGVVCSLANTVCCDGRCVNDPCGAEVSCGAGQYCDSCTASCREDLCPITECPDGYECRRGECLPRAALGITEVAVSGAGGCSCELAATRAGSAPWSPWLLIGALWLVRRSWRRRRIVSVRSLEVMR